MELTYTIPNTVIHEALGVDEGTRELTVAWFTIVYRIRGISGQTLACEWIAFANRVTDVTMDLFFCQIVAVNREYAQFKPLQERIYHEGF